MLLGCNILAIKSAADLFISTGNLNLLCLILLNTLTILSSSKGNLPHNSANNITPADHTSTSAPD